MRLKYTMWRHKIESDLIVVVLFILFSYAIVLGCILPHIPEDENSGESWVFHGELSRPIWQRIKPYYSQKLSISEGELLEIFSLFDNFECELPSQKVINSYLPWSSRSKEHFLTDYPFLIPILPILSFVSNNSNKKNSLLFSTTKPETNRLNNGESKIKFKTAPVNYLTLMGNIQFSDQIFRWYSREIKYSTSQTTLSIGNFSSPLDNGIFLGYFPNNISTDNPTPYENWLYSEKDNWNGASLSLTKNQNKLILSTHRRSHETIELVSHRFHSKNVISTYTTAGFIMLENIKATKKTALLTSRIKISRSSTKIATTIGISSDDYKKIPLIVTLENGNKKIKNSISLTYLPNNFIAPLSITVKNALSRLNTLGNYNFSIFILENSYRMSQLPHINLTSDLSYIFTQNKKDIYIEPYNFQARFSFNLKNSAALTTRYFLEKSTDNPDKYRVNLNGVIPVNRYVKISPAHELYIKKGQYTRLSSNIKIIFSTDKTNTSPSIELYANNKNSHFVKVKLSQIFFMSDKTYGEYRFTLTPNNRKRERISFYATLSFNF